jgi:DNA-binding transcriptional MerR regulator
MYTVKQLSELAGVSVRTLHYYDEFGLLRPAKIGANGYRYYDDAAVLRLQQILFYRELGMELAQVRDLLDQPGFDLTAALYSHRSALQAKIQRLQSLVQTVDDTLKHLLGEDEAMGKKDKNKKDDKKKLFKGFSEKKQKEYEREARLQYGPDLVNESAARWEGYGKAKQADIMAEAGDIYADLVAAMQDDLPAGSETVNAILRRWHDNIRHFYEPTLDILRGLGTLYNTDPAFQKTFRKFHDDLPAYLEQVVGAYVDELENAELVKMLADEETSQSLNG